MSCQKPTLFIIQIIMLYFLSSLLPGHLASAGQTKLPDTQIENITSLVNNVRQQTRTPGISVGLVYANPDNSNAMLSTWQYQSGYAHVANKTKLGQRHIFRTGSVSKLIVSIAIMQLVEQQKLTLQSRVTEVLPNLSFDNPWQNSHPLLVAHLLNHSSGWDAPHFAANIAQKGKLISTEDALALRPETRTSRWPPGARTAYNNTGYLVLAAMVEKLSHMPFEQYAKANILGPLNMDHSDYFFTDHYQQNAVSQYKGTQPVNYQHINNRPAGALNSTNTDLLKLVTMMMNKDESVLSNSSKQLMMSPSFSHYSAEGVQIGWGLGVTQITRGGITWYGHEGSLPGAVAFVGWEPTRNLGIVVLINTNSPAVSLLLNQIGNLLTAHHTASATEKQTFSDAQQALTGHYLSLNPISSWASLTSALPWKIAVQNHQAMIKPFGAPPRPLRAGENTTFLHASVNKTVLATGKDPQAGKVIYYGPNTLQPVSGLKAWLPVVSITLFVLTAILTLLSGGIWLLVWAFKTSSRKQLNGPQLQHRILPICSAVILFIAIFVIKAGFASATPFTLLGQITAHSVTLFVCSIMLPALLLLLQILNLLRSRAELRAAVNGWQNKLSGFMAYAQLITGIAFITVMFAHGYVAIASWM